MAASKRMPNVGSIRLVVMISFFIYSRGSTVTDIVTKSRDSTRIIDLLDQLYEFPL